MKIVSRRSFLRRTGVMMAAGSFTSVVRSRARADAAQHVRGYGPLRADPAGVLELPHGFSYRVLSREGDALSSAGRVPASHDGMGAFAGDGAETYLIRNHELGASDGLSGRPAVPYLRDHTYDRGAVGGTTTLRIGASRQLIAHDVSLAGTLDNCGGGPTPWGTWLTCEETDAILDLPHGYVFEVDPRRGGNPEPIRALGRFEHEAVSFGKDGIAYLTEDASGPFGCLYRFRPERPLGGRGSLHAGGVLQAMAVTGVDVDLSSVSEAGSVLPVRWVDVRTPDPGARDTSVRVQAIGQGATPIQKAEGTWRGHDGTIWFVSSYGAGPDAEDADDASHSAHGGQLWRYDPRASSIALVTQIAAGSPYDGPDNITVSPHGFVLACTDGDRDQWLIGIDADGTVFPFARNAMSGDEFAGATFSPDGQTLFVNMQGKPSLTFAIWGPWSKG